MQFPLHVEKLQKVGDLPGRRWVGVRAVGAGRPFGPGGRGEPRSRGMRPLPHGPWGAELLRCAQQEVGFWSGILGACR